MIQYKIRNALPKDIPDIIKCCIEHAAYEKATYDPIGKADKLNNMLFGADAVLQCLLVESENEIIGYISFSRECSTWSAAYYVHMDCLYVMEHYRGNGIGEALVHRIIAYAKQINANHIEWQTPVFNERAIKFYKRIGAIAKEKLRFTLSF
jgi:GNAT superfamily N-acetyltransferase